MQTDSILMPRENSPSKLMIPFEKFVKMFLETNAKPTLQQYVS